MKSGIRAVLVVVLLVAGSLPVVATVQSEGTAVRDVRYTGEGEVSTARAGLYLWQSEPHAFEAEVRTDAAVESAEVCVLGDAIGGRELACRSVSLAANSAETVTVAVRNWPANMTGERRLTVRVRNRNTGRTLADGHLPVTVIRKRGDRDTDGLTNRREARLGTNFSRADTDADGLDDSFEVGTYRTDPLNPDGDNDGLEDGAEVRTHRTDPRRTDTDGDRLSDGDEVETHETNPNRADTDGDLLDDGAEVNRYQTDPAAVDTDGDGLGDGAEVNDRNSNPTDEDTDGDSLTDGREWMIFGSSPTREDTDGDGLADAAEVTTHQTSPTSADTDGDGVDDGAEVRTHGTDPNRADTDSDGLTDRVELRRGSDPTSPTTNDRGTGLLHTLSIPLRRPAVLLGGGLVLAAALAAALYWADPDLSRVPGWIAEVRAGAETESGTEQPSPETDAETWEEDGAVLTNEERVRRLLESNDGRMLQSEMVEAADWSKATVSRVLSKMEENGAVTRVDIGKGNIVTRPGDEPVNSNAPSPDE